MVMLFLGDDLGEIGLQPARITPRDGKARQLRESLIDRKGRLTTVFGCTITLSTARWQSGYAAVCKTVYIGSIPVRASIHPFYKLARQRDCVCIL